MASLNYMQTTTFKFFLRFFILYYNFGAAARMLYALCVFHKGSILWAKFKMSMQHQLKHISPNFNLLQNFFLRCHFFIYSKNLVQQLWDLKQMVVHNSQDTPWTIFSKVLCSLAFIFNGSHLLKNASCKVWFLGMVSTVFQDIWDNGKT